MTGLITLRRHSQPNEKKPPRTSRAFGPTVMKLLNLVKPDLDVWGIFDLGEHPLKTFAKGRMRVMALMGDAAHATSPHHGSGAGFCIDDPLCWQPY
jgi:salicylate hydroxylase